MSLQVFKNYYHLLQAVFAGIYYGFPAKKIKAIGVTGTDGKTTTVHLIYEILKKAGKKASMISSVYADIGGKKYNTGFHVTNPDSWFLQKILKKAVDKNQEYIVLEVTSHGLDQYRVWGIPFEIGVLTNVTNEHLDYHKSYEEYLRTKLKLLQMAKTAVVNREDKSYIQVQRYKDTKIQNKSKAQSSKQNKWVTYGIGKGDVNLSNFPFQTKLPGDYNKLNCLAAASAAKKLGIADKIIKTAISQFSGVLGRFEYIKTGKDFEVIIDFAHTPNSLEQVLQTVRSKTKGKLIHVFGCAGLRDFKKRPKMGEISAKYAGVTILTEEDYRTEDVNKIISQIEEGMTVNCKLEIGNWKQIRNAKFKIPNRQVAIDKAIEIARKGDVVILTGKGHEKSLCRGKVEYPWSEHEAVRRALKSA